jgi:hypothetical protein
MSPILRRYGAMALAVGLLAASAASVKAQGFGTLPNQRIGSNPNMFLNPALAQAQFLYGVQAQASANPFSNPYLRAGAATNPLVDPYSGSNVYTPGTTGDSGSSPYYPGGYGYYESPWGGFLRGAADLTRAYGTVITSQEQARIMREAAKQARLETEKKRFDLERYIKENTPSFTEEQAKVTKQILKKVQTTANPYEIWAGSSLNTLLDDLRKYPGKRASVEPINLPESVLRRLNVTKSFGNLGLLREDGRFRWPLALQDLVPADKQKDIEIYAEALVNKARNGKVEANVLRDLNAELTKINESLFKRVNEMPTPQYMEAKKFLRDFEDATRAIEKGDAAPYFEFQAFVSKGPTVQEIADYMIRNGLKFASATQGDEAAYQAMHSALAAYDVAVNTQLAAAPPAPGPKDQ